MKSLEMNPKGSGYEDLTYAQRGELDEIRHDQSMSKKDREKSFEASVKSARLYNAQAAALPQRFVDAVEEVVDRPDYDSQADTIMREVTLSILRVVVGWKDDVGDYTDEHLAEVNEFLGQYIGKFISRKAFGEHMGEEEYPDAGECDCCPDHAHFYVDWDLWARDQEWNGRWSPIIVRGWEYWFWNN